MLTFQKYAAVFSSVCIARSPASVSFHPPSGSLNFRMEGGRVMSFEINNIAGAIIGQPRFEMARYHDVNPVSGRKKWRTIAKPNPPMRDVHQRFRALIEKDGMWIQTNVGTLGNAKKHEDNRFFYQTDLAHAYQSVHLMPMARVLLKNHSEWREADLVAFLEKYCFARGGKGLIVGAPASNDLFDIYADAYLDDPLLKMWMFGPLDEGRWESHAYTRYCDDLTFSSPNPIPSRVRRKIRNIVEAAGFQVNDWKTSLTDLTKNPVVICGIGLEHRKGRNARVFLPRRYAAKFHGMLHLAIKGKGGVNHEQINGMWSVFSHTTFEKSNKKKSIEGLVLLNETEKRIWSLYHEYRRRYASRFAR